jgi:trigger factor
VTTEKAKEEYKNEEVEVAVERKEGCQITLTVKSSNNCFKKAQKKAIKTVAKEVSLPGFRKGKAPDDLILKKHPKEVADQVQKDLANIVFSEAQNLAKIPLLSHNASVSFNIVDSSPDKGSTMTFSFETEPNIPSVDPSNFKLKEIKRKDVGDTEIDEALRQALFFYAEFKDITDRPIKEDDYVIIDLASLEEETPQTIFADTRFELKDKSIAQWMKKLLIGAKTGDVIDGISQPDEDLPEEEKSKYENKKVRITVKKVEEITLPELDDEFAKKLGAKDVPEMKKSIAEMLNRQSDEKVALEKRDQVNLFLIDNFHFELPSSLVQKEKEHRLKQYQNDPKFRSNWNKMSKEEKEKTEKDIEKRAKNSIDLFYLSKKIVDEAKLSISQEEIEKEAQFMFNSQKEQNPEEKIPQENYAIALSKIMLEKAQDYILKKSNKKA